MMMAQGVPKQLRFTFAIDAAVMEEMPRMRKDGINPNASVFFMLYLVIPKLIQGNGVLVECVSQGY